MSEPTAGQPPLTAGQWLKHARESVGMHIAMLAAQLKVPVKKIQALEDDDMSEFASPVFARTLASSVCRVLKCDPAEVLALLPQSASQSLISPGRVVDEPVARFSPARSSVRGPSRNVWLAVGALALLAVLMAVVPDLPDVSFSGPTPAAPATPAAPPALAVETVTPTALANQVQVPEVPASSVGAAPVAPVAPMTPATPAPNNTSSNAPSNAPSNTSSNAQATTPAPSNKVSPTGAASPAPTATTAPTSPTAPTAGALVAFSTTGESWIQVFDAQGQPLLSRVVQAGETVGVNGATPLKVVVGRADVTQVTVRGQSFSMAGIAQSNVARFEVK